MEIKWINKNNLKSILNEKSIFIYGYGSLAHVTAKWLVKNGVNEFRFCVDREYLSDGILAFEECIEQIRSGEGICIYAVGENKAFFDFKDKNVIPIVYAVFNPFEFWIYDEDELKRSALEINKAKCKLADDLSKRTFEGYIEAMKHNDGKYSISNVSLSGKYFNELTGQMKSGCYVDIGAYNGDTIEGFRDYYHDFSREIHAFEPDGENFSLLQKKFGNFENINLYNMGVWDCGTVLSFNDGEGQRSEISEKSEKDIKVVPLDSIITQKTAYIKIGTGNIVRVIDGMKNIVLRDMPLISMYALYSLRDLYILPQLLSNYETEKEYYRIYLRHHSATTCGLLFFYAIPTVKGY